MGEGLGDDIWAHCNKRFIYGNCGENADVLAFLKIHISIAEKCEL